MSLNLPVWRANVSGLAPLATAAPGAPATTFQSVRAAVRRVRARMPALAELVVGDTAYDVPLHTPVAAAPAGPTSALGRMPVGAFPTGIAVSPEGTHVYVVNSGDDSVSAIDADTAAATIAVGRAPYGIALTPDGRTAYVTNAGSNSVSIIDTQARVVTATIAVGENPYGVAVGPHGGRVYVTNQAAGSLTVIDSVTSTIAVGAAPMGVAVSPDGQTAYVVDNEAHSLILVDTDTREVTKSIPVGKHPAQVAITPDGAQAYVTNAAGGSVSVVDLWTATVTETLLVSDHPIGVAIGADGRFAFVTALDGSLLAGTVTIIDIRTSETNTVRAGAPYGVTADPSGDYAYITDFRCQAVSLIDANDGLDAFAESGRGAHARRPLGPSAGLRRSGRQDTSAGIAIDRGAYGVVADPDSGRAFVIHSDDDAIEVIDSSGRSTAVDVGRYPSAVALTRDGTRAYVTNYEDGTLSILDTAPASDSCNTVIGTLDIGLSWSTGVVLSRDGSRAYAVDQVDGHLSVIDTVADSASRDTVVNDIELGDPPTALCIAPNQRWVYAINHFDHVVWAVHTVTKRAAAIRLPAYPYRISLSPNGLRLYASLCGDGSTCVIDTDPGSTRYQRVISRLCVDGYGPDPVFSTAGARAYVVNSDANSVSVIDTRRSAVKNIAVGEYPWDLAVSPDGCRAYVVNNLDNSLSILRSTTDSVTATIPVGARPCRVAISAAGDRAFVVNSHDDSVSVIDTSTASVSNTITVGSRPSDVTVSADGQRAFVRHRDGLSLVAV